MRASGVTSRVCVRAVSRRVLLVCRCYLINIALDPAKLGHWGCLELCGSICLGLCGSVWSHLGLSVFFSRALHALRSLQTRVYRYLDYILAMRQRSLSHVDCTVIRCTWLHGACTMLVRCCCNGAVARSARGCTVQGPGCRVPHSIRRDFADWASIGSSSGPVGLLPKDLQRDAASGELMSFHAVGFPPTPCLMSSTANVIS